MSSKKGANDSPDSSFKSGESKPEWAREIEARLDQLEQSSSGKQISANRRSVLKGSGALGLGALLGVGGSSALTSSTGTAEAQSEDGSYLEAEEGRFISLDTDEASTDDLSPKSGDASGVVHAITSLTLSGRIVGYHPDAGIEFVDAANYSDDVAALEAVNDGFLMAQSNPGGVLFISPAYTATSMAELGSTSQRASVGLVEWPPSSMIGDYAPKINSAISDGSPMFKFVSDTDSNAAVGSFLALSSVTGRGGGSIDCGLAQFTNQIQFDVHVGRGTDFGASIFRMDGAQNCNISGIYQGGDGALVESIAGDMSKDSTGVRITEDTKTVGGFGGNVVTDGGAALVAELKGFHEPDNSVADLSASNSALYVQEGHYTAGGTSNPVFAVDGINGINLKPDYVTSASSGLDATGTLSDIIISPAINWGAGNLTNDSISIANAPSGHSVVPDSALVEGSVTYPTGLNTISAGTT